VAQVIKHLLSKHKVLSLNPSTEGKKRWEREAQSPPALPFHSPPHPREVCPQSVLCFSVGLDLVPRDQRDQ
jgi:hypothetical protein